MIKSFRGKYSFLSNFYDSPLEYDGLCYRNSEAAFQAQKTLVNREQFCNLSPSDAKKLGRRVQLRNDWENIKLEVMYTVVKAKFFQNDYLKDMLLATGEEYLEEGNTWGDRYWGTCNGVGENMLGRVLMQVRDELNEEAEFMRNSKKLGAEAE